MITKSSTKGIDGSDLSLDVIDDAYNGEGFSTGVLGVGSVFFLTISSKKPLRTCLEQSQMKEQIFLTPTLTLRSAPTNTIT